MQLRIMGCSGGEADGERLTGLLINGTVAIDAGSITQAMPPVTVAAAFTSPSTTCLSKPKNAYITQPQAGTTPLMKKASTYQRFSSAVRMPRNAGLGVT